MSNEQTMTVTQYAAHVGITGAAVRWQIANGKLPKGVKAEKAGAIWFLKLK